MLLCVSYPSAIEFSTILFLHFARSSTISPRSLQRLTQTLVPNFIQIRLWVKNFPIAPTAKIGRFLQRYNVALSGQVLQWGSMGKFYICCRIQLKFRLRVCLKRWNDRGDYELDRAKSKNNIAENSVALGHETHNRRPLIQQYKDVGNKLRRKKSPSACLLPSNSVGCLATVLGA